jgi:hypothetical protein
VLFSLVDFSVVDFSVVPPGWDSVVVDFSVVVEVDEPAAGAAADASAAGAPGTTVVVVVLVSFSVSVPLHPLALPSTTANPINTAAVFVLSIINSSPFCACFSRTFFRLGPWYSPGA